MDIHKTQLVVIGGGAAGMMCAATAAGRGVEVVLIEPNRQLGRKVRITGKGRCNVTNNCDVKEFMRNIPGDGRFLYSALNRLSPTDTIEFFESGGLPLKTERGNRVFPVSDNANDVAAFFTRLCEQHGVKLVHTAAEKIIIENSAVTGVKTSKGTIKCSAAAVCTGGLSYPLTGSTGDGYRFAEEAGHRVSKIRPSLVPLESSDAYCGEMQGFSLRNVALSVFEDEKLIFKEQGEMLFTHFGVSGPLVLSASSHMRNFGKAKYRLEIDLKPALDEKKLDARILRDFEKYSNKEFKNSLCDLEGSAMIPVLVRLSGIPGDTKVNSITREQRMRLLHLFKAFPVNITGTRPIDEAIVSSGGVCTKEINPRTMESKLVKGLYFAGEVLDVDGYTGGFNLQIAWSTGYVAGNSINTEDN
ncbi:MAG: NAD(P)/FAD-dependent oxidoreductase [Candidatus Limivicinus sp.]|jgi:predicted Rossmann fold flavoprotein